MSEEESKGGNKLVFVNFQNAESWYYVSIDSKVFLNSATSVVRRGAKRSDDGLEYSCWGVGG